MFVSFKKIVLLAFLLGGFLLVCSGQPSQQLSFFEKADTLHPTRFWVGVGVSSVAYTGAMIGLNELWYADYPRGRFRFFDDRGEWEDMDKIGHFYSAYVESRLAHSTARWMGMRDKTATWVGVGVGTLVQTSIEVLDGFSEKWGFSLADIGFNTLGCGLFAAQQLTWHEQRITMKLSSYRKPYSTTPILSVNSTATSNLRNHTDRLFGTSPVAAFLKDYNAQTIWLSANIASFLPQPENRFPKWLNIAVGYGVQNVFGGYGNTWREGDAAYRLSAETYPRYRQWYVSLDVDLTRIKTDNDFLRTLLFLVNMIKIPSPTLEFNNQDGIRFHPIFF